MDAAAIPLRNTQSRRRTEPTAPSSRTLPRWLIRVLYGENNRIPPWMDENCALRWFSKSLRFLFFQLPLNLAVLSTPLYVAALVAPSCEWHHAVIFSLNLASLLVLAVSLRYLADNLSTSIPYPAASLWNISVGAVIELMITIEAIRNGQPYLANGFIVGSILNAILLTLGLCFVVAGVKATVSAFNIRHASTISGMLMIAVASMFVPGAYQLSMRYSDSEGGMEMLYHGTAIILMTLYFLYAYWKLHDNRGRLLNDEESSVRSPTDSPANSPVPAGVATVLSLVALGLAMACIHNFLRAVPATSKGTGLGERFIAKVLLPLVVIIAC